MSTSSEKNTATLLHLSALTQYLIPFGNYIFPIIIWNSKRKDSEFVDYNGKQVLNFQLSMLLYSIILVMISGTIFLYTVLNSIPFEGKYSHHHFDIENMDIHNLTGIILLACTSLLVLGFVKLIEFILIIYGAVKASNGEQYRYPLSISFFK